LDASQNLVELADWCENNFTEEGSKEQVKYNPEDKRPSKLYGGKTLKTTGQFAIQVLNFLKEFEERVKKHLKYC
jgi:hypothetical protein